MSRPLVSISLLCSNRKKTIRKCLDSLQPLRGAVSTELIIVDTGCDEETRAILEEYADQIVDFEWCKDFSKARNAGLEKCSGEWFLYIDDDEWFIDMDEIIDFFVSGNYKNYQYANYIQRNYMDYEERAYSDAWVSRMVRMESDTRFESSIHEIVLPIFGEPALLHSVVKHFGYIYESKGAFYQHAERNISLLWEMVKKERECTRWWTHLIQEYFYLEEYNKLIDVCNEALEICKNSDQFIPIRDKSAFYMGKILAAHKMNQIEKAKKFYEEAISDPVLLKVSAGALFQVGARIYYELGDKRKFKECALQSIELYDHCIKNERMMFEQDVVLVKEEFKPDAHCNLLSLMVSLSLETGNFDEAIHYFRMMNWETGEIKFHDKFIFDIVESCATHKCNDVLIEIAQTLMKHKKTIPQIIEEIQKREELDQIAEVFSHVESEHFYIYYLKILYADQKNDSTCMQEYYEKIFLCVGDILNFDNKFWEIAKKYNLNLDLPIMKIPFDCWKNGVDSFCRNNSLEIIQKRFDILCYLQKKENIRYDYLKLKVSEAIVTYGITSSTEDETDGDKMQTSSESVDNYDICRAKLCDFVENSLSFYQKFFKEVAFEGEMEMLPASCRAAVKLNDVLANENWKNYQNDLESMKAIIGVYAPLDPMIQKYSKLYGKMVLKKQSASKVLPEMLELAKKLTEKAEELMAAGDVANAEMILRQVSLYLQN